MDTALGVVARSHPHSKVAAMTFLTGPAQLGVRRCALSYSDSASEDPPNSSSESTRVDLGEAVSKLGILPGFVELAGPKIAEVQSRTISGRPRSNALVVCFSVLSPTPQDNTERREFWLIVYSLPWGIRRLTVS